MPRKATYGKQSKASKAERLFAELPQSPMRKAPTKKPPTETEKPPILAIADLMEQFSEIRIKESCREVREGSQITEKTATLSKSQNPAIANHLVQRPEPAQDVHVNLPSDDESQQAENSYAETTLRILSWEDVCPHGDRIEKIAEASYAEVYRVTNDRGTSIIKVIRLHSPIRAKTKAQDRAKLVDEEPHAEEDIDGELQISEWLADIPGFVVYKERYVVQGKATRQLLETHQVFQRRMKRQDPGRAQFYPSPSRYLDDTRFLVVELGDAGIALEDWKLTTESQLWDIFFLVAVALARAEDLAMFEVRTAGLLAFRRHALAFEMKAGVDTNLYANSIEIFMKAICVFDKSTSLGHSLITLQAVFTAIQAWTSQFLTTAYQEPKIYPLTIQSRCQMTSRETSVSLAAVTRHNAMYTGR